MATIKFMKSLVCEKATKRINCCNMNDETFLPRRIQITIPKNTTKESIEEEEIVTRLLWS